MINPLCEKTRVTGADDAGTQNTYSNNGFSCQGLGKWVRPKKNPLGFFWVVPMQKNPPGFKPSRFFTLSFSHVKKQMKT